MLGCIIEDFCHCPASSCLGHQQTHSSYAFHTPPSCRQRGKGEWELQPDSSKQWASLRTLALVAQNKRKTKDICFTFPPKLLHFAQVTLVGLFQFSLQEKKTPIIFNRRKLWQLSMLIALLCTNNGIADVLVWVCFFLFQKSEWTSSSNHRILSHAVFLVRAIGF